MEYIIEGAGKGDIGNLPSSAGAQKEDLLSILKEQELEKKMLAGDINAFGEYIKQYCTKVEDGKKLCVELPPKGEFEGFNFECELFDLYSKNEKSINKIGELLDEMGNFVKAYGYEFDEYEFQEHVLKPILPKGYL